MRPPADRTARSPRRLRVRCIGDGPPLVLVHGLAGSSRWWRRNVPALSARHRLVLVDLHGFGGRRDRFVLRDAADGLAHAIDEVAGAPVDVVAHSMGGIVAARLAVARPDAVRHLVLVAPAGLPGPRGLLGSLGPLLATLRSTRPDVLATIAADAVRAGPWTVLGAARDIFATDVGTDLGQVRAPTLLVWGERDRLVPVDIGEAWRQALPQARLALLPGVGHLPMLERPEAFDRLVLQFLGSDHGRGDGSTAPAG